MKKQTLRHTASTPLIRTIGHVQTELAVWDFHDDEELTRHIATQLAKAIMMNYNMGNFGPESFGLEDGEE